MNAKPLTVFCDFDGTITEKDMVVSICEKFCPPVWKAIVADILSQKKSVKEGVAEMFSLIPSTKKEEIIQFAHSTMRPRAGFQDFLQFCRDNGLRFIVCSGGVDFFVEPLLEPYKPFIQKIYSIPSDFSGLSIALKPTDACDTEGTCKVKIMEKYPETVRILIGDSITDLHGAKHADLVFARSGLQRYLDADKISYRPFETFYDVITTLSTFRGPHETKTYQKSSPV